MPKEKRVSDEIEALVKKAAERAGLHGPVLASVLQEVGAPGLLAFAAYLDVLETGSVDPFDMGQILDAALPALQATPPDVRVGEGTDLGISEFSKPPQTPPDSRSADRSEEPNLRDAALCLLAADTVLCDDLSPEDALAHARVLADALREKQWADGRHSGDCTKAPHTCIRCMVEEAEAQARVLWEGEDDRSELDASESRKEAWNSQGERKRAKEVP